MKTQAVYMQRNGVLYQDVTVLKMFFAAGSGVIWYQYIYELYF